MKIMFICTGNICRSAMAHWLMIKKLEEKNIKNVEVFSAGIHAMNNDIPTEDGIEVMDEYGVNLRKHRATNIRKSPIEEMDLILVMTVMHKMELVNIYPNLKKKIFTLKEYVGENEFNIKDPWGYNITTYRMCAAEIDRALDKLIGKWNG